MSESRKIQLAGLWAHRTLNGLEYFSGRIGSEEIVILANEDKHGDDEPDYFLYVTPDGPTERSSVRDQRQILRPQSARYYPHRDAV
jgi:hypothetical protein